MNWTSYIFNSEVSFKEKAITVFKHQYQHVAVYRKYVDLLGKSDCKTLEDIPFLPIDFFKTHDVIAHSESPSLQFESSGTTGQITSKHLVADNNIYIQSIENGFNQFYENTNQYCFLALLPGYLERKNSSLVHMVNHWISNSNYSESGFYLDDFDRLSQQIQHLEKNKIKTILIGVTYALLDFAEQFPCHLKNTIIMETGGMKGKRRELPKTIIHKKLKSAFAVDHIHSEYGMAELLSQAYATKNGLFRPASTMKVLPRDVYDALSPAAYGVSAAINIVDLANVHSCSFIATHDLGKVYKDGSFQVLGRIANSDLRGCNLLVE